MGAFDRVQTRVSQVSTDYKSDMLTTSPHHPSGIENWSLCNVDMDNLLVFRKPEQNHKKWHQ